ncbi:MAG: transporter substrate-binding domain-containing protein [Clostridiales bacterium]|jgi:polar amino acid transport system substrate-binding protein|nr:transporter substrate-binding domain-containing protein [Clostridiales bacterium]MDR2749993.1 transporter substrate-binding domain-containing protein [Clostridiales bacterium]
MKKLMKLATAAACFALVLSIAAGCSATASGSASNIGLLTDGVLKVGCEIGYPPFELYDDDGTTPIGLDVELGKAIAKELGLTTQLEDTAWDGIFAGLDVDKYDCIISAVTIDAERREKMDFTQPYIENWQAIVVKTGTPAVTSMKGLDGLSVGYQDATTSDDYLAELIETGEVACKVNEYDKVLNCFDDLRLNRINAVLCDSTVANGYLSREPGVFEITWIQSDEPGAVAEVFGIAVKKGNTKLLDALNGALRKLEESGELDNIRKNWL